jgi:hypothetical protein
MQREGLLSERFDLWLKNTTEGRDRWRIYEVLTGSQDFSIKETEPSGQADLRCSIPAGYTCVVFHFRGRDGLFQFLQKDNSADGAVLFIRPDGQLSAWIVELKKKISQSKWQEVLEQFRWTLARLLAITGVLGLELKSVTFTTAFREDRLSPEESPNPTLGKAPLGIPALGESLDMARRRQLAWVEDRIRLQGFTGEFWHTKVHLDGDGNGTCRLGG